MKNKLILLLSIFLFAGLSKAQEFNNLSHIFTINNINLVIEKGDITKSKTEAIVNAANEELLGGAGVCGSIFNAAGWNELQTACNKYAGNSNVRCQVGQACITDSFQLKSNGIKHIIHAVGPDCRVIKDKAKQDQLLESAYRNSLILAEKNSIQSIAFPFISSAIYAFPKDRAAVIALNSVIEYTKSNKNFSEIHFVLFSQEDFDLFCNVINRKLNLEVDDNTGNKLLKLKFNDVFQDSKNNCSIIREYDANRKIYVINVLSQNTDNTCGRHAIKNLIYFINAIEKSNDEDIKRELKYLYDIQVFELLNKEICQFFGLRNIYTDLTFPHKIFNLISSFNSFFNNSKAQSILKFDKNIISSICPVPMSFDKGNIPVINGFINDLFSNNNWMFDIVHISMIYFVESDKSKHLKTKEFYKKYKLDNKLTTKNDLLFNNIFPSDDFKKYFEEFKKSDRKTFGFIMLLPVEGTFGHWISVVIKKSKNKSYEYFILDSGHSTISDGLKNSLDSLLQVTK